MWIVDDALRARARDGEPIRVGVSGAGFMGRGMVRQMMQSMVGFDVVAIYNRNTETAHQTFASAGINGAKEVEDADALDRVAEVGGHAVALTPEAITSSRSVDVVMESTGQVEFGAHVVTGAIEHRKHVVLVNAELDSTVGPLLKRRADAAGVVYTNVDGDEPGVAMNMLRFVKSIGYLPVLAGNVKGFLDPHRNPETQAGFARTHGQRPKMITSFADGTKLSMEGAVLANASGFGVAKRGMTGHPCDHVRNVTDLYSADELLGNPIVDFVLGAEPGSGAFVVGYDEGDEDRNMYMRYFKMGDGPLYVFYRPFHLTHLEAPFSIARAALFGDATVAPLGAPVCGVLTMAKRDLQAGATLDGIGGFTSYGLIDNIDRLSGLLAMGLSEGCVVRNAVAIDQPLTLDDVEFPEDRLIDRLWAEQAEVFA